MTDPLVTDPTLVPASTPEGARPGGAAADSALVRAARRQPVPHTPVWFMRQAGRSLPEYRALREGIPMLESCMRPDLVHEITMQPVRRHGVDAAIFFSDIVLPLKAIGVDLDIVAGTGPVVAQPIRSLTDVQRIPELTADDVRFVTEAIGLLVDDLGATPLIGFAGAPYTLASYLIEGGPSRHHERTKAFMHAQPEVWSALLGRLSQISAAFLQVQIDAGASAVQLFDSWAGSLSKATYARFVQPHTERIFTQIGDAVPRIHFGVGTAQLLGSFADAGADVVGVDWCTPLDEASRLIGPDHAVQGNLDPALLFADWDSIESEVRRIIDEGRRTPGHIFNLGHGVMPATDPEVLTRVVALVHEISAR